MIGRPAGNWVLRRPDAGRPPRRLTGVGTKQAGERANRRARGPPRTEPM